MTASDPRDLASERTYDVVVIGAGFGGLATALTLAERGARVAVCETLRYPGGCASTFRRKGFAFESGATLFSGLAPDQLFGRWIERHNLPVTIDWLDPLVELHAPGLDLPVPASREALLASLRALPGAPVAALDRFFAMQRRAADVLWELFADPALLPPFDLRALLRHAARSPRYLILASLLGRPLLTVLERFDLQGFAPLRTYLDAVLQITVQCSAAEAEAPFALAAMDYFFRGTGHVRGGIGALATALVSAIRAQGGDVFLSTPVRAIARDGARFRVSTRRGELSARTIAANLLPQGVRALLGAAEGTLPALPLLDELARRVETGWGAAMLYGVTRAPDGAGPAPQHLELIVDPSAPFIEGNHVFVSISGEADTGRAPPGHRTFTASTHLPMPKLRAMSEPAQAAYIETVQTRMKEAIARFASPWWSGVLHLETASPRTFERFTGRFAGLVGGIPRRAGLGAYRGLGPSRVLPGLYLVGDSVFPGQSTLGTAIGGLRLAARLAHELGLRADDGLPRLAASTSPERPHLDPPDDAAAHAD